MSLTNQSIVTRFILQQTGGSRAEETLVRAAPAGSVLSRAWTLQVLTHTNTYLLIITDYYKNYTYLYVYVFSSFWCLNKYHKYLINQSIRWHQVWSKHLDKHLQWLDQKHRGRPERRHEHQWSRLQYVERRSWTSSTSSSSSSSSSSSRLFILSRQSDIISHTHSSFILQDSETTSLPHQHKYSFHFHTHFCDCNHHRYDYIKSIIRETQAETLSLSFAACVSRPAAAVSIRWVDAFHLCKSAKDFVQLFCRGRKVKQQLQGSSWPHLHLPQGGGVMSFCRKNVNEC